MSFAHVVLAHLPHQINFNFKTSDADDNISIFEDTLNIINDLEDEKDEELLTINIIFDTNNSYKINRGCVEFGAQLPVIQNIQARICCQNFDSERKVTNSQATNRFFNHPFYDIETLHVRVLANDACFIGVYSSMAHDEVLLF